MKTLTGAIKKSTGLSVRRTETSVLSKTSDGTTTTLMSRFGNKVYKYDTADIILTDPDTYTVIDLPGQSTIRR